MSTDYLNRMYWPARGPDAGGENFTTYGRTIAMSAKLSAADRRNVNSHTYRDRHAAFMNMVARQNELEEEQQRRRGDTFYNSYNQPLRVMSSPSPHKRAGKNFHQSNRSKTFMAPHNSSAGHNITTMPLDIAVYNAPSSDPFVPNNSYKEYTMKKRGQSARLPMIDDVNESMMPVHRLYRSGGGYDDSVKAYNHIREYRPELKDQSEYKVRQGRNGGVWRHVKEVMQGKGERIMFVDGITSIDDLARVKTNMINNDVSTPRLSTRPAPHDNYTKYVTPKEMQNSEGVNWNVMR